VTSIFSEEFEDRYLRLVWHPEITAQLQLTWSAVADLPISPVDVACPAKLDSGELRRINRVNDRVLSPAERAITAN
jgi:hypothetical protein